MGEANIRKVSCVKRILLGVTAGRERKGESWAVERGCLAAQGSYPEENKRSLPLLAEQASHACLVCRRRMLLRLERWKSLDESPLSF